MGTISGVIFLDKPQGWTSRRAVNEVVRLFGINRNPRLKAGHAGTLDPMATGMLPILIGEATRFAEQGLSAEKTYSVTLDLSYQTETLDTEGETTARFSDKPSLEQVRSVLERFYGKYEQVPPRYSALRIDGKRAHKLARLGKTFELPARAVEIRDIQLVNFNWPLLTLEIQCSKGTYVRALARDIGNDLGLGGCVVRLRRLSTGGWPETMMVTPEELADDPITALVPVATWLKDLSVVGLSDLLARRFLQGQRLRMSEKLNDSSGLVAVYGCGILLGTAELSAGEGESVILHPIRILPSAQGFFKCNLVVL